MHSILQFAVFLITFVSIYGLMQFYVLARLAGLFSYNRGVLFYLLLALAALSFVGSRVLIGHVSNIVTKSIYTASAVWMGVSFLLFSTLLVYEIVRLFIKIKPSSAGLGICVIVGLLAVYAVINAQFIHIKTVSITSSKIREDVRIVQLSDIHFGSIHTNDLLERIVAKTQTLNPDIVCITGDLIDKHHNNDNVLISFNQLKVPVLFVTGNHENYIGKDHVKGLLKKTNIQFLQNQMYEYNGVHIIGIN
ncbi:MAG: metallophosphoesterase, partial [bacterium]